MIRARFYANGDDYRPVKWPIKYPYWCSGYTSKNESIIVAYADSTDDIKKLWPEAHDIEAEEVDEITYTSRFPKPSWYTDLTALKLQPHTTPEQSELLLKMGLKKETSDMTIATHNGTRPAWSLARLVEIAFDQNGPDSVIHLYRHSNAFNDVIGFIDYQIEHGFIKSEYLKQ